MLCPKNCGIKSWQTSMWTLPNFLPRRGKVFPVRSSVHEVNSRFGHLVAMFFHLRGSGGIQSSRTDPQADGITRITKDSITFKWPSWVIFDQNFRQEVVNYPGQSWARVNSGIHADCFTNQLASSENWCSHCHILDHAVSISSQERWEKQICQNYNQFRGDCVFGKACKFACSACGDPHPVSKCQKEVEGNRQQSSKRGEEA